MKAILTLSAFALIASTAVAQTAPPPARTPVSRDPAAAPAGSYALDARHASIIARLAHGGGTSLSTFRFGTAAGTLTWNGAAPEASKLSITVDMTSLETPVPNFASELIGEKFLKTGQFHDATFVSTGIAKTGSAAGKITGNLTFMGVTKPVTIDATLVGAGKTMRGADVVGFSGTMKFKRSDFGFSTMVGPIGDDVEVLLDVEFGKAA